MVIQVSMKRRGRDLLKRVERAQKKAEAAATKRASKTVRAKASTQVAKQSGLRTSAVKRGMKLGRYNKVTKAIKLTSIGRPLNLGEYRARRTRKGVTAYAYGKKRNYKGAFILSHRIVAKRTSARRNRNRPGNPTLHNEGLRQLYGPGIGNVASDVLTSKAMIELYRKRYAREYRAAFRQFVR